MLRYFGAPGSNTLFATPNFTKTPDFGHPMRSESPHNHSGKGRRRKLKAENQKERGKNHNFPRLMLASGDNTYLVVVQAGHGHRHTASSSLTFTRGLALGLDYWDGYTAPLSSGAMTNGSIAPVENPFTVQKKSASRHKNL